MIRNEVCIGEGGIIVTRACVCTCVCVCVCVEVTQNVGEECSPARFTNSQVISRRYYRCLAISASAARSEPAGRRVCACVCTDETGLLWLCWCSRQRLGRCMVVGVQRKRARVSFGFFGCLAVYIHAFTTPYPHPRVHYGWNAHPNPRLHTTMLTHHTRAHMLYVSTRAIAKYRQLIAKSSNFNFNFSVYAWRSRTLRQG